MNMSKTFAIALILVLAVFFTGCTKKTNLTGTNWSDVNAITFTDSLALADGYTFPADSLVSITSGRKNLLVGKWQGAEAKTILRFTGIPADSVLADYHEITDLYLDLVVQRRNQAERTPLNLKLHKVLAGYAVNPDTLETTEYSHILDFLIPDTIPSTGDTLHIALPFATIQNWQSPADSSGLNILVTTEDEGFAEIKISTATVGSKLRYKYKATSAATEYSDFSTYAIRDSYSFTHPEASPTQGVWKISNFSPQRMYIDLQPDSTRFKDMDGHTLSYEDLKRVNINKAEIVLFVKTDQPNLNNTFSYSVYPLLVKESPEGVEVIETTNMELAEFTVPSVVSSSADSLVINITPIIQAYTSDKKEAKGIVIISNNERKDFGEIEFYHIIGSPNEKQPYIRVKYTPPFL